LEYLRGVFVKSFRFAIIAALLLALLSPTAVGSSFIPANPMKTQPPTSTALVSAPAATPEPSLEEYDPIDDDPSKDDPDWDLEDDALPDVVFDLADDPFALTGGVRNILLVGLDARPGQKNGRSDTIMLVTLDTNKNLIKLTSIMRDNYVDIPGKGGNRINTAWVYGGANLLIKTLERNFGILVEDYVCVDFSMLADLIDQIGGIRLSVDSQRQMAAINDVIREDNRTLKKPLTRGYLTKTGEQLMTGMQAQAYARYRKLDSDFMRTARQRIVIMSLIEKSRGMSVAEMSQLITANSEKVYTNMTAGDMLSLVSAVLILRDAEVLELRIPIDGGYESRSIRGMSVLVPDLKKNQKAFEDFMSQ